MNDRWLAPPSVVCWGRIVAAGLLVVGLFSLGTRSGALDALPEKGAVPDLAVVPPDALGFAHIRVAALRQSEFGKAVGQVTPAAVLDEFRRLEPGLGVALADVDRLTAILVSGPIGFGGHPELVVAVSTVRPYDRRQLLARLLGNPQEETYRAKVLFFSGNGPGGRAVHLVNDRLFVVTEQGEALRPLLRHLTRPRGEGALSPALKRASGPALVVAGCAPAALETSLFGPGRMGPDVFGAWMLFNRLQGAESAIFTADAPEGKVRLALEVNYCDELLSRRAQPALRHLLALAQDAIADLADSDAGEISAAPAGGLWDHAETLLNAVRLERKGTAVQLGVTLDISEQLRANLPQLALRAKLAQERRRSVNNLKQLGLALHAYHDTYGHFPVNFSDRQGKPTLSWRVGLLPYLEEGKLYQEFRLTEPWDSEHNKKLLAKMPKVFAAIDSPEAASATFYQGFAGPGTVFGGPAGTRLAQITDGTSNTIMVIEAGEAVPWTKPTDLPYDAKQPLPALGGAFKEGIHAVFCDGAVHFLRRNADQNMLRTAITMNDGLVTNLDLLTGTRSRAGAVRPFQPVQTFKNVEMKLGAPAPVMKK